MPSLEKKKLYFLSLLFSLPSDLYDIYIIIACVIFYCVLGIFPAFLCYNLLFGLVRKNKKTTNILLKLPIFSLIFYSLLWLLYYLIFEGRSSNYQLFLNNHITVIIMMVLPIFLTVCILFKIYKYFKKKRFDIPL